MEQALQQQIDYIISNPAAFATLPDATVDQYRDALANIPAFTEVGNFTGVCLYAGITDPRPKFDEDACLQVYLFVKELGKGDFWESSISNAYVRDRDGNVGDHTQTQRTAENLASVGCQVLNGPNGWDFSPIMSLIGKPVPFRVYSSEYNGKLYYRVAVGASKRPMAKRRKSLVVSASPASFTTGVPAFPAAPSAFSAPVPQAAPQAAPVPAAFPAAAPMSPMEESPFMSPTAAPNPFN